MLEQYVEQARDFASKRALSSGKAHGENRSIFLNAVLSLERGGREAWIISGRECRGRFRQSVGRV